MISKDKIHSRTNFRNLRSLTFENKHNVQHKINQILIGSTSKQNDNF